jgi:hypothetical protein
MGMCKSKSAPPRTVPAKPSGEELARIIGELMRFALPGWTDCEQQGRERNLKRLSL